MGWRESLRHAFAIEKAEDFVPSQEQKAIVDKLCRAVVRRQMALPSKMFVEVCRPLNYLASQTMHFFMPTVRAIFDGREYRIFAEFLEHRGSADYLIEWLEHYESMSEEELTAEIAEEMKERKEHDSSDFISSSTSASSAMNQSRSEEGEETLSERLPGKNLSVGNDLIEQLDHLERMKERDEQDHSRGH